MAVEEDENEPRWQGFRINQLGLCISLFLTFAVATLGFSINLLIQPKCEITTCPARAFFLCFCSLAYFRCSLAPWPALLGLQISVRQQGLRGIVLTQA